MNRKAELIEWLRSEIDAIEKADIDEEEFNAVKEVEVIDTTNATDKVKNFTSGAGRKITIEWILMR